MNEQLICSKCGKSNWSQWFETCSCKEPDFRFKEHAEYLEYLKRNPMSKEIIGKFGNVIQVNVTSHIIITTDYDGIKQEVILHDNQAEELIAQLQEAIVRYREVRKSWEEGK